MIDINAIVDSLNAEGVTAEDVIKMLYNRSAQTGEAKDYNEAVNGHDVKDSIVTMALYLRAILDKTRVNINAINADAEFLENLHNVFPDEDVTKMAEFLDMISVDAGGDLVFSGYDAGTTFKLADLNDFEYALFMFQRLYNEAHGLVTFYPANYYRREYLGVTARFRDGYFCVNGTPTSALMLRMTNTLALVKANTVDSLASGLQLTPGEAYRVKVITVGGTRTDGVEIKFTIPSVYKLGGTSSIGNRVSYTNGAGIEFVAPTEPVNIVIYLNDDNAYSEVKGYVTLEKIQGTREEWTELLAKRNKNKLDAVGNYSDPFVQNNDPETFVNGGVTVEYKSGLFRINGTVGNGNMAFRMTDELGLTLTTATASYSSGINLTAGKRYRVKSVNLNGESTAGISVYKIGENRTIGERITGETGEYIREFTAPAEAVNIVIFMPSHGEYEDVAGYVTLQEISDEEADTRIEPYYNAEMEDTIEKVRNASTEASLVFMSVTDIHRFTESAGKYTFDKTIKNMAHFAARVKCDFLLNLGDLTDGNMTQATTLERAYDSLMAFRTIGVPYLFINGNHDTNYEGGDSSHPYLFTPEENYKAYFGDTPKSAVFNLSVDGSDYYIDYPGLGVRVLVINANSLRNSGGNVEYRYADNTVSFVEAALDTDNAVLLCVHQSPYSYMENGVLVAPHVAGGQTSGLKGRDISNLLIAFVNGGGTLIEISGHSHRDMAFVAPWVSVMSAANKFYNSTASISGIVGNIDEIIFPARVADTAAEDSWNVNVYNAVSGVLHVIRFGAGNDRIFHVYPIAPTTLTSQLTSVTWSSSDTTVATVSDGVVTAVGAGRCAILAKDTAGNYECWVIEVPSA